MIGMVIKKLMNWYSKKFVQQALLEIAKNREVISVYKDGRFGKRPDVIQYPRDIIQAVSQGTVSFHGSVERWNQPMKLDVGLTKPELDSLRSGWDIFIDPDVNDFEIAKVAVKQIIEALKEHGLSNYSVKFTGGKGFHIGVPFETLPQKINLKQSASLYPDILQKIMEYLKWYTKDRLKEEILALDNPVNIAQKVGKSINEITGGEGIEPFKIITMDIFGSRHLFRLPYSLHEKTFLVSLPIKPDKIDRFKKEHASPEKAKVDDRFLVQKVKMRDSEALVVEALDWASKFKIEVKEELPKSMRMRKIKEIPEELFPPCIKLINKGLADGRKRSTFVLINFLKNMGWSAEKLEKKLKEWNEKNYPPLRANYLRSQLRWHLRQSRNLLPPNCDNPSFYQDFKVCVPDETCKAGTDKITIKNPVNYPFRKIGKGQKRLGKRKKR